MVVNARRLTAAVLLLLLIVGGIFGVRWALDRFYKSNYPQGYSELVSKNAAEFSIDVNILYAIIKTESDFQPDAVSNVGARGLMQIMEDTFHWIKTKLGDFETEYDDMYQPEQNIRYGAFLIGYLYQEFGSYETAVAAYHAGRTATAGWLANPEHSSDGETLDSIPSDDTGHYVNKVMDCYKKYTNLYPEDGDG